MNQEPVPDVFDDLANFPYIQTEEEQAVENVLMDFYRPRLVSSDEELKDILQDLYIPGVIEKVQGAAMATGMTLKKAYRILANFAGSIKLNLMTSILSEERIRKRFSGLRLAYLPFAYESTKDPHAYCIAPEYSVMTSRLSGLANAVYYLKQIADSDNVSTIVNVNTYAKIESMVNGTLKLQSSNSGFVNHLVWSPPPLVKVYCQNSPLAKPVNIDNLCNAVLFLRDKVMTNVVSIVDTAMKKTEKKLEAFDEDAELIPGDDSAETTMRNYSVAYMLTKMTRDVVKQGIQREVNTLAINYIHKLKAIKRDE